MLLIMLGVTSFLNSVIIILPLYVYILWVPCWKIEKYIHFHVLTHSYNLTWSNTLSCALIFLVFNLYLFIHYINITLKYPLFPTMISTWTYCYLRMSFSSIVISFIYKKCHIENQYTYMIHAYCGTNFQHPIKNIPLSPYSRISFRRHTHLWLTWLL